MHQCHGLLISMGKWGQAGMGRGKKMVGLKFKSEQYILKLLLNEIAWKRNRANKSREKIGWDSKPLNSRESIAGYLIMG